MKIKYLKRLITAAAGVALIVTITACTQTQGPTPTQAQTAFAGLGKDSRRDVSRNVTLFQGENTP